MAKIMSSLPRSRLMARIHSFDTGPEKRLRRALWSAGLRYRLRVRLPGKPDVAFLDARVAVFVDGCFWHGCPLHGHTPKSNPAYWIPKLERNLARDQATDSALLARGWMPLRIWEHEVTEKLDSCVERIAEAVRYRSSR